MVFWGGCLRRADVYMEELIVEKSTGSSFGCGNSKLEVCFKPILRELSFIEINSATFLQPMCFVSYITCPVSHVVLVLYLMCYLPCIICDNCPVSDEVLVPYHVWYLSCIRHSTDAALQKDVEYYQKGLMLVPSLVNTCIPIKWIYRWYKQVLNKEPYQINVSLKDSVRNLQVEDNTVKMTNHKKTADFAHFLLLWVVSIYTVR